MRLKITITMRNMFIQSVTQATRKKNGPCSSNRSRTYDLLVTSPDALPLSDNKQTNIATTNKYESTGNFRASRSVIDSTLSHHFSFSYSSLKECQFIPETQNAKDTFLLFQCSHRLRELEPP